ncbi:MAG: SPFH domain-containing protein, partial [Solirubrobacteraceae bacterium]
LLVLAAFVVFVAARTVRIVPQARAGVVERLGRYNRTLDAGLTIIIPFIDRLRPLIDLREQVVTFPPQPVITEDNLVVQIDTVIYFTVTNAKSVTYEVANPLQAIEQLTVTTLRNVTGGMSLEAALTSRDHINGQLRVVLDEATGKWGIRVNRVELKSIDPPGSIQEAMEKQMRAERDRRAAILTAEGVKQSQILTAEGEKVAAVLKAEGGRQSAILRAEGEAKAIETVFGAIHDGRPDPELLSYQYLQMLPKLADGSANKVWVIPSEFSQAFGGLRQAFTGEGDGSGNGSAPAGPPPPPRHRSAEPDPAASAALQEAQKAAAEAAAAAAEASRPGGAPALPESDLPT